MLAALILAPALVTTVMNVSIEGFAFVPESVFVQPGDTVRWTNNDDVIHTTTSVNAAAGLWNSGNMGLNKTYQFVFKNVGSYDYNCRTHSGMLGWVTVSTVVSVHPESGAAADPKAPAARATARDVRGRALEPSSERRPAVPTFRKAER